MMMVQAIVPPISDKQLREATGMSWSEWIRLLDVWDADKKTFASVANYLMKHYKMRRLYAQIISVYYNWERLGIK
jgi:hypothetical protein